LKIALWVIHGLICALFLAAGGFKGFAPADLLLAQATNGLPWIKDTPLIVARIAGISEFFGALGLLLPLVIKALPARLPGLAAAGLTLIMILAAGFHIMRGELVAMPANLVIGAMTGFVAWGRLGPHALRQA